MTQKTGETRPPQGQELEKFKGDISKMEGQFELVLPKEIPEEKFLRVVQTAVTNNPLLLTTSRASLFAAAMEAAESGLLPNGKESAIVPMGNKATFIPMVKGLIKKAYQIPNVELVSAQVICEKDAFSFSVSEAGEKFTHTIEAVDRGDPVGVYAYCKFKSGEAIVEVMSEKEIEAVKGVSKQKSGPWTSAFSPEMWRKSALKRLIKRLPMSNISDEKIEQITFTEPKLELEELPDGS